MLFRSLDRKFGSTATVSSKIAKSERREKEFMAFLVSLLDSYTCEEASWIAQINPKISSIGDGDYV